MSSLRKKVTTNNLQRTRHDRRRVPSKRTGFKALNSKGLARYRQAKDAKTIATGCFTWTKNARAIPSPNAETLENGQ